MSVCLGLTDPNNSVGKIQIQSTAYQIRLYSTPEAISGHLPANKYPLLFARLSCILLGCHPGLSVYPGTLPIGARYCPFHYCPVHYRPIHYSPVHYYPVHYRPSNIATPFAIMLRTEIIHLFFVALYITSQTTIF